MQAQRAEGTKDLIGRDMRCLLYTSAAPCDECARADHREVGVNGGDGRHGERPKEVPVAFAELAAEPVSYTHLSWRCAPMAGVCRKT